MSDLDLISPELRRRSQSAREIVLPHPEVRRAIDELRTRQVALLGWEAWLVRSDGSKTHSLFQGTASIVQQDDEPWADYVERSAATCAETIESDLARFRVSYEARIGNLFFCLTPLCATPTDLRPASGRWLVRMVALVTIAVMELIALVYVTATAWLLSVWFIDDAMAANMTTNDWWRLAIQRATIGLLAALVLALIIYNLNFASVPLVFSKVGTPAAGNRACRLLERRDGVARWCDSVLVTETLPLR